MSMLATLACGMVDYDHPELSKDAKKQIRRAVRHELAALDFGFVMHRQKRPRKHGEPMYWDVVSFEATNPDHPQRFISRRLNEMCEQVQQVLNKKEGLKLSDDP